MKWRLAMSIATSQKEGWLIKAAEWNPELSSKYRTNATSKEQIRKMLCEFKKATEKVGVRIHPDKTKILSNQSIINSDTKKELEIEDMKIEILTENLVPPPGNDGNQKSNQSCMGDIPQTDKS